MVLVQNGQVQPAGSIQIQTFGLLMDQLPSNIRITHSHSHQHHTSHHSINITHPRNPKKEIGINQVSSIDCTRSLHLTRVSPVQQK
jgi:hypothetical protein